MKNIEKKIYSALQIHANFFFYSSISFLWHIIVYGDTPLNFILINKS